MEVLCAHGFPIRESIKFKRSYSRSLQTGFLTRISPLSCVLTRESSYPSFKKGDKVQLLFSWGEFRRYILCSVIKVSQKEYELQFFFPLQKDRRTIEIYIDNLEKKKKECQKTFQKLMREVF